MKQKPGTREDFKTGQFFPTVDGRDISPTSFSQERALEIATLECNRSHTPTEWQVSRHATPDAHPQYGIHDGGNDFCIVKGDKALADLISSAPDGLELANQIVLEYDSASGDYPASNIPKDIYDGARRLIAKTKGIQ